LDGNTGDCARAIGRKQVTRHDCEGSAGVGVVEVEQVNRAWQVFLAVGQVGAVPLHASGAEAAAEIGGHGHKPAIRAVSGHVFKLWFFGEVDHRAMRHGGRSCHAEVSLAKEHEGFFHNVDAAFHVGDTSVNHVGFAEVAEVDCLIGQGLYLSYEGC